MVGHNGSPKRPSTSRAPRRLRHAVKVHLMRFVQHTMLKRCKQKRQENPPKKRHMRCEEQEDRPAGEGTATARRTVHRPVANAAHGMVFFSALFLSLRQA